MIFRSIATMVGILGGSIPSSGFSLFIVFVPGCIRVACSDKQLLKRLESVKKGSTAAFLPVRGVACYGSTCTVPVNRKML